MTSHAQYYEENLYPLLDKILKTANSLSSPFYLTGGTAETTIQLNGKEIPVRMKAILHCDKNWGIGKNNSLMFRLPKDMAFFRRTTKGKTVVMGKNTLLSLPGRKPLKDRTNIILSSSIEKDGRYGFIVASNLEELKAVLSGIDNDEIYVIGGAMTCRLLLPYCDEALVTKVDADGNADVFFEDLDRNPSWELVEEDPLEKDGDYITRFCRYKNKQPRKL